MPNSFNTADEYDIVNHQDIALDPEVVAQLREWLEPTDYLAESGEFRRHLLSQAPKTGLWVCQTDNYLKWKESLHHGSLWIKGVPGAGKSVMAASLIQHLKVTQDCPVLFFFFRNIVTTSSSPRALLQDWLAQLLPYSAKLQFAIQSRRLTTMLEDTSDNELIQLFIEGISCVPRLYCVADALDEMATDNTPFLEKLNSLATHRPETLKLLITSRPEQHLQKSLRDSSIVHISLQQSLVGADILAYLSHRFDMSPKSDTNRHFKQDIIDMVVRKSQDLFLVAKLTMDQLEESLPSDTPVDIVALETSLPVGLEQTYTRMLAKKRDESGITTQMQLTILEAITHTSRPLRLNELASLLECVCPKLTKPNTFKSLVALSCGSLIEVLEDETLQVIHHSFTEFLRGESRTASTSKASTFPIIDSLQAHRRMALNCLEYLQAGSMLLDIERSGMIPLDPTITFMSPRNALAQYESNHKVPHLKSVEQTDPFDYRTARLLYPFLSYAVENWSYHASFYDVLDDDFIKAITSFVDPQNIPFLRWLVIEWGTTSSHKDDTHGIPTPLHLAASAGLSEFASRLLRQSASVSALDAQERTPLHWAAVNGHLKVASLLLQHGVDPDADDIRGLKPIHLATLRDRVEVVNLLLRNGVSPDTAKTKENYEGYRCCAESTKGETAITYASRAGCIDTILAMATFCDQIMLGKMLCLLCSWDRPDAVEALLDNSPVSPDATYRDATALYYACGAPSSKCVRILINRGADVKKISRVCEDSKTFYKHDQAPIHRLVKEWSDSNDVECRKTLKVLLKGGADIDQPNGEGSTALLEAATYSRSAYNKSGPCLPSVKALVEEGADVNGTSPPADDEVTTREWPSSVLHRVASNSRDLEVLKLLVDRGCDLNSKTLLGQTVLLSAMDPTLRNHRHESESKTRAIIEYLLDQGADPSCHDNDGNSPLSHAMSLGASIFRILFAKCQEIEEKKRCWFSLSKLRRKDTEKFSQCLEMFLAEGFDIDTKDEGGKTLYLNCCLRGPRERLEILQNHGANPSLKDDEGNNALFLYCLSERNDCEAFKQLISHGVSPLESNNHGNSLLHLIAMRYKIDEKLAQIVHYLISLGVSVSSANNEGSTPLHLYQGTDGRQHANEKKKGHHFIDVLRSNCNIDFRVLDNNGYSSFHIAATKSESEVAVMIDCGVDINLLTSASQNALHLACRAHQPNIVCQLLTRGISFDQQDNLGRTPLYYACRAGEAESVAWLLRCGASPHLKASDGSTILHACADVALEEGVSKMSSQISQRKHIIPYGKFHRGESSQRSGIPGPWYLRKSNSPPPKGFETKFSPGLPKIIESLIESGVDVSCRDNYGTTALDLALFTGCSGLTEIFYRSDKLLEQATKHLETNNDISDLVQNTRRRLRLQISLMLPRPYLDSLPEGDPGFTMLLENPGIALGLLSTDEIIKLTMKSFKASPLSTSVYELLGRLVEPSSVQIIDHLKVIESISEFVISYSIFEGVKARLEVAISEPSYCGDPALTALAMACSQKESNLLTVKALVEKMKVDVNAHFASVPANARGRPYDIVPGGTALHTLASAEGYWHLESLKYLLAQGAHINAIDEKGETPLHIASGRPEYGKQGLWKMEAVKILLERGADVNILNGGGESALHKASWAPDIIQELLRHGSDANNGVRSPLFDCIRDQNLETMNLLLKYGANADAIGEECQSCYVDMALNKSRLVCPLVFSAFSLTNIFGFVNNLSNSVPLLVALIQHGANLYVPLNDDETLIHFLFEDTAYEVIEALLQEPCVSRIDFNRRDQRGRTILMAACSWRRNLLGYTSKSRQRLQESKKRISPVEMLSHGANTSLVDFSGKTALHHLLNNPGYPDHVLISFINRQEVSPTLFQKDSAGNSPLHCALGTLRPAVCEALLEKGADLSEPDSQGRTALHYIASQCLLQQRQHVDGWRWYNDLPEDFFGSCISLWNRCISQGGSINAVDNAGNTPLHSYLSMLDTQRDEEEGSICHVDHYEILFPEESGVDVFAVNKAGETALHKIASRPLSKYLVEGHDKALFAMMMEKGLDPLKEDAEGRSALDVASACDKEGIVGLLARK
ncbi:hypothetical protein FPOA_02235 [Fusarium poae]|uniref:Nephrocystin 3-like N-terminal domain-containing protein n=1 Tax=Fusarium poae TaxID=36050 RepID=A0A1B8B6D9_FUSPO|nr:hypothetical protein FPOA_02235 [Fusarium poae]